MGLLDQVIGGVVGQVLGGGRGVQSQGGIGGALSSPIVKALLMLLLSKGASGGFGNIFGGGGHEPQPRQPQPHDPDMQGGPSPYGRGRPPQDDDGDLGGFGQGGGGDHGGGDRGGYERGDDRGSPSPYGRGSAPQDDDGDRGGYERGDDRGGSGGDAGGGDFSDLSGMLDGPGERGQQSPGRGPYAHLDREPDQSGGPLGGGLDGLIESFQRGGMGDVIGSWIGHGGNQPLAPNRLADALGPDTVDQLSHQTGLNRDDLLQQLSQALPGVIDQLTPHGRPPNADERRGW